MPWPDKIARDVKRNDSRKTFNATPGHKSADWSDRLLSGHCPSTQRGCCQNRFGQLHGEAKSCLRGKRLPWKLMSDECCHLLSSWSEKCSFVFVKKLCSWRWTKYRTYEKIMVSKNQKPIHLVTKRQGSCFLSYCKSFLPVQSAGIWKAWNLVTNKISSRTSKVFQSY